MRKTLISNLRKNAMQSSQEYNAFLRRLHSVLRSFENQTSALGNMASEHQGANL